MERFLFNLEENFLFLTGSKLEYFVGLFIGLVLFCLLIQAIRFERKKTSPNIESSNLTEVGDENIAKLNLSRSLIEMGQRQEANKLLTEVIKSKGLSEDNKEIASSLLNQISDDKA
jgi:FimV-like protein